MGCGIDDDKSAVSARKMRLYLAPDLNNNSGGNTESGDKKIGDGDGDSSPRSPIPDSAMLSDHSVKNDSILNLSFLKEGRDNGVDVPEEDDAWEDIDVLKVP